MMRKLLYWYVLMTFHLLKPGDHEPVASVMRLSARGKSRTL